VLDGQAIGEAGQRAVQSVTKQATSLAEKRWKLYLAVDLDPLMFGWIA
jgi:hypothetical protein